jgi:hypothetical protein
VRARLVLAGVALSGLVTAAGCVSPRNTLGTNSSPCYRAVPVATDAVHDRGQLAGVRLVGARELDRYQHLRDVLVARAGHPLSQVCVVSFHGDFRPDDVAGFVGEKPEGGSGPVAVVVVTTPQNHLVGTFVLLREPLPLRHEI